MPGRGPATRAPGAPSASYPTRREADAARARAGLADEVVVADARDPVALRDAVAGAGGPADVTVVCVDVPGCEGGAILATAEGGTVIFFSMATSFTAAALGAEGLAADVTMLVGNGYVPGHAGLRAGAAARRTPASAACSSGGCDGDAAQQTAKLDLDPATVRKARSLARKVGRPIVTMAQQHTTVSVERATLRLAGLAGADAEGTPWVNRLLDAVRADVGLEHGVALPVWDALAARRGRRPRRAGPEGVGRLGPVPAARGPRRHSGRAPPRASRSAPASRRIDARRARARAAGQAASATPRASRGST